MQLAFLALALGLVRLANSQYQGLPDCAKSCVTQFTSGSTIGGCPSLDVKCICSTSGFLEGIACCLAGACSAADQQASVAFAQNLCKTAGVTNLPAAVSCASTSAPATGSSGSSPAPATGSSTGTTVATGASPTTSAPASATSGASTGASSASASATRNAGAQNMCNIGAGLLGGLAAVVMI